MDDAEKRLHKLSQKKLPTIRRAKNIGLKLDFSALEKLLCKNFVNQDLEHNPDVEYLEKSSSENILESYAAKNSSAI